MFCTIIFEVLNRTFTRLQNDIDVSWVYEHLDLLVFDIDICETIKNWQKKALVDGNSTLNFPQNI